MASTFVATGTYSNLTRLQLEQLRKADFFAGSKALTVGDSALPPEGVVGPGDINAEPFLTGPNVLLDDVYSLTPAAQPGPGLGTSDQPSAFVSETVKWYGPTYIYDGTTGYAASVNSWEDTSGVNFVLAGVQPGDILLIKTGNSANGLAVATVTVVLSPTTLVLGSIKTAGGGTLLTIDPPTGTSGYLIMRPNAVQLFAVPASGATGFEQTFLAVAPGSTIHNVVAPTTDQINAARIKNLVPSQYALDSTVDRSDSVFDAPAPRTSLDKLGYRVVLYTDNGLGTGPNLANPIATLNPVIDPTIPATDQRMTIDYKAGIIRLSCAPKIGGQIKVAGGVNPTTGRLNLYAVFWAVDTSLTAGAARTLYAQRSTTITALTPGRVSYDTATSAWRIGATTSTNAMFVQAPNTTEDARKSLYFGYIDSTATSIPYRYFSFKPGGRWKFTNYDVALVADAYAGTLPVVANEQPMGEALEYTVADFASPPFAGADFSPSATINSSSFGRGARDTSTPLNSALAEAAVGDFTTVRLKRGTYQITDGVIYVPPGVVIEGDGPNTIVRVRNITASNATTVTPGFKFGPNTSWGVYDITWDGTNVHPTVFDYTASNVAQRLEGVAVVWNPVRRVWAVSWADTTLDAVWFNEIKRDGTTTLPGFGVNVKTTANPLFSQLSPNSSNHTAGHYPRIVHQINADQYVIAWVDQVTISAVVGPQVYLNIIEVNPAVQDATPTTPSGVAASVTFITTTAYAPVTVTFSDHPSIAADNSSNSPFWTLFFQCWTYLYPSGAPTSSGPYMATLQTSGTPSILNATIGPQGNNYVISSTDVDQDDAGNALFVWSRRLHPLIMGSHGEWSSLGQLSDSGIANWTTTGIVPESRFCYLGASGAYAYPYDTTWGVPNSHNVVITPYGTDGTVLSVTSSNLVAKPNAINATTAYTQGVPYLIVNSTTTGWGGGATTTLTDTTQNFSTNGVAVGDMVFFQNSNSTPIITQIAPGGNNNQIVLSFSPGGTNQPYRVYWGSSSGVATPASRQFNWAVVPPSVIEGMQYGAGSFVNLKILSIAGYGGPFPPTTYIVEPIEPDHVRVRHGGDNWLVVYQSYQTTSFLSGDSQKNWNDGHTTWNGLAFLDNTLYMRENTAPYRHHLSTCVVALSSSGTPLNSPYNVGIDLFGGNGPSSIDSRLSRDVEISGRSLGALWEPLTYRPNAYSSTGSFDSLTRSGQNLALQVSPLNTFYRWTGSATPTLLPDVTFTGEDFVVVSPTKKSLHGHTGNYIVDGSGNVYFGDPAFYFGLGGPNQVDANYLRQTVSSGDFIYFPAIGKYGTINSSHSEHTVHLANADSALFNFGNNTQHSNIEWVLIRTATSGSISPGGNKPLGYRVTIDGRTILSSSMMTYADELPENSWLPNWPYQGQPAVPERTALMSRANTDVSLYWVNPNTLLQGATVGSDCHNLPGNISDDIVEPEGRIMGDVGFRGVAPGSPHGVNDQALGEGAFCAIAWGENFYGYFEHIVEGATAAATGSSSTATNQVRFFRQSFGPYRSGMRNLKIQGFTSTPQNTNTTVGSTLKVLTQQRVFTRHGGPVNGHGFFATDGFRCFFPSADKLGVYAYNNVFGQPRSAPFEGGYKQCIQAYYTDAIGRRALRMQGPEVHNKPWPGLTYPNPNTYHDDIDLNFSLQPSAPRAFWDGERFVAFWTEGGYGISDTATLLCMATFPGGEDAEIPGPELGNANDFQITRRVSQISLADSRNFGALVTGTNSWNLTIMDVAYSGKVYAVLWAAGLDPNSVPFGGQAASQLGVTLFENTDGGGTYFDYEPAAYASSTGGNTSSNILTDATPGAFQNFIMSVGDVVVIQFGVCSGTYVVVNAGTPGQVTVYPSFPTNASGVTYSMHRPRMSQGAASYILGSTYSANSGSFGRDAYNSPCIVWDGKQFVAIWRSKLAAWMNPDNIAETSI